MRRFNVFIFLVAILALWLSGCTHFRETKGQAVNPYLFADSQNSFKLVNYAGITVLSYSWQSSQLLNITMKTAAVSGELHTNVIVPKNYFSDNKENFPAIYLYHGCDSSDSDVGQEYEEWLPIVVPALNQPVILVMPEGGPGGFYTNWYNSQKGGPPEWETFDIDQLIPFIDFNFRAINNRGERAAIGLSMGGFGAMSYAARHPDLFAIAASFSGADDLTLPGGSVDDRAVVVVDTCAKAEGGNPNSVFGSPVYNQVIWDAHDPTFLAKNLSNTKLYLYTGNGEAGPFDPPNVAGTFGSIVEQLADISTSGFYLTLEKQGIPVYYDNYGPGTHSEPYWARDFSEVLPMIMADFKEASLPPKSFNYMTADANFSIYNYNVEIKRKAMEFATLKVTNDHNFAITASGTVYITPPAVFGPNHSYGVRVSIGAKAEKLNLRSNSAGSLSIEINLGKANTYPQFSKKAVNERFYTAEIKIGRQ
jgi:S-formylglutathione hydrolase FrmB